MLRKAYHILAVCCIGLVLAVAGFAAYLAVQGDLSAERLSAAARALTSQPVQAASQPVATAPSGTGPASERLAAKRETEEVWRQRFEMYKRQLANERALIEAARLTVLREKEELERAKQQWRSLQEQQRQKQQMSGFQKELEILSSVSAKTALALLRQKQEADAAQILMAMQTRKGRKIVELCKTDEEKQWIGRVLELIRQQDNVQAAALAGG